MSDYSVSVTSLNYLPHSINIPLAECSYRLSTICLIMSPRVIAFAASFGFRPEPSANFYLDLLFNENHEIQWLVITSIKHGHKEHTFFIVLYK